ncbi:MarR family transcriptional regulator [Streptomyces sp. NPDC006512]|uniref:MarR family transcriptional regulator n=1 Tax=Streptomyces sp. NPDC006512 TaxID=3154307 RepID=UPI0033B98C22
MTLKEYPQEQLAAQAIGYWTGAANTIIINGIRKALAQEDLTQPHWWILNHLSATPATWTRTTLTAKLARFDTQHLDFEALYDDLATRGWTTETPDHRLTLTEAGEAGRRRARARTRPVHERMHAGIDTPEYTAAVNVLRRMIDNLGGDSDLP